MQHHKPNHSFILTCLWLTVSVVSRIIPHPFNATAILSLTLWASLFFNRTYSIILMMFSLLLSNICLHFLFGYAVFGSWSLFTFSGLLLLLFMRQKNDTNMFALTIFGVVTYWTWTNFGTWLMTNDLYPKTIFGLMQCFIAGLPFLKHNVIGSLIYSTGLYYLWQHKKHLSMIKT